MLDYIIKQQTHKGEFITWGNISIFLGYDSTLTLSYAKIDSNFSQIFPTYKLSLAGERLTQLNG